MDSVFDLDACLDAHALHPGKLFLRTPDGDSLTYADLRHSTGRCIGALQACGVMPGDRVLVQIDKSIAAVVLYLACLRLGAVFVPLNVAYTAHEIEYFLQDAAPRLAVFRPQLTEPLQRLASLAGVTHVETLGDRCGSLWNSIQHGAPVEFAGPRSAAAPAAIVYTSGTTGRSKGAVLTRGNLASNAAALALAWRFSAADVLLHTLPLFHVHGLFAAINTVVAAGASVLLAQKFDAGSTLALLSEATVYMGVPTHYTRLLSEPGLDRGATSRVRLFVSGSAPLLADTHRDFERRTGHRILERYGMTETLMNTSNPYEGPRLPGSVGPPLPGVSVRLAMAENGDVAAVGTLEILGPNVFSGYWRDEAKTRDAFTADRWFKTGDLGRIDADGYIHIVGRARDLVISGGFNVYPKEVELALDAVGGVLESAVFGVPHPDFGEGVTAAIVARPGALLSEFGILGDIKARLAGYKIPKRIVFVDELPRNAMGKVQKNELRSVYATLYRAAD